MLTCASCEKQVIPTKAFALGWFMFWLLFAGVGAIGYLIYFAARSSTQCPVCGNDVYGRVRPEAPKTTLTDRRSAQREEHVRRGL